MARPPTIRIKIDVTGLSPLQAMMKKTAIAIQRGAILEDVGEQLARRMRESIAAGRTAQGRPAPKPEDGRALFNTGALLASIRHTVLNRNRVEIGTSLPYAPFVHGGSIRNRPAPFAFTAKGRVVAKDRRTIERITREHIQQIWAERDAGISVGAAATQAFARMVGRR